MSDNSNNLRFNRPPLFQPNFVRGLVEDAAASITFTKTTGADMADSTVGESGSFKYDVDGMGVKSTQQLNIDWSEFQNHTFFNSAQVKTNVAFDTIINRFPFDGTQKEYEQFFDLLTGFEKWVFDVYPKYKGYGFFSGSASGEVNAGTWVTVKDMAGAAYPGVSKEHTGEAKLNPGFDSMTIESWVFLPSGSNPGQTILNKLALSGTALDGFALVLSSSSNGDFAQAEFHVVSRSVGDVVRFSIPKGSWQNVAITWDRTPGVNKMYAFVNQTLTGSSNSFELGETFWGGSNLTIGSGSSFTIGANSHDEQVTLSGALDDVRIWHAVRTAQERVQWQQKSVFGNDDLKLYFKFNEPSGSNTLITLDSSGNSLHGQLNIAGNALGVREIPTGSIAGTSPMTYEKLEQSPILFPEYPTVEEFRGELLLSASNYDTENPNLITKLIPPHYLLEGQMQNALETEFGQITTTLHSTTDPRSAQLGGTQILLSLMYVWAKYFDEMKLFTEAFSTLNWADYDSHDTVPDQFLQFLAQQQGFTLPPLFTGTSIEQYINRENIQDDISTNTLSLQHIQNQIWRRILINLQDIVRSKGTLHAVKSFIRATGIDPDNNFRIREFGGPTKAPLTFVRDKRSEVSTMADFVSGGLIISPYLSGARVEPGYPAVDGTPSDGLWTSGSFTYEGTYKFPRNSLQNSTQSLARMMVTGLGIENLPLNLVAMSGSSNVTLYASPQTNGNQPILSMSLDVDIFDGDKWYVSFGRQRNDDGLDSVISSSYFLRAAKQSAGEITEAHFTQSFFNDWSLGLPPTWQAIDGINESGAYLTIGSASINTGGSLFLGNLFNPYNLSTATIATAFEGRVGQIRFWSKFLESSEWQEHVRNFKSLGVQDPTKNFNFVTNQSGSFERLRMDISTDQMTTQSNVSGEIEFFDFSQNSLHWSGSVFPTTYSVMKPERFHYSYISPKFDEASTTDKVRPRSFLDYQNVLSSSYAQVAPLYKIELSEEPTDNTRFTIDFSIVDALDQDVVGIFSTLDALDNIIGNPELMFSPDYPQLEVLRDIYFNRLTDKINLRNFFEFYKWFDTNIGSFIGQLIPRKTKYLGTNFVIESHMLERPKLEYHFSDIYLGDSNRHGLKDTIVLQLITGDFRRY